jgi:hypothetical protein
MSADQTQTTGRRSWPLDEEFCIGMDVPCDPWTAEDVRFWNGTKSYQPWKDVAAFFRGDVTDAE